VEVWVAEGMYRPTDSADRTASIRLHPGVDLYGGFAGVESERGQRNWTKHETILSGAISENPKEHSLHVVIGADDALIDGFTIRDGHNLPEGPRPHHLSPSLLVEGKVRGTGAGMFNYQCAPTVRNCLIRDNSAFNGAGMYSMVTRDWPTTDVEKAPVVVNCVFARNHAEGRGGAVSNYLETHSTFIACTFIDNRCDWKGGAMYNDFDCSPELASCVFARNQAMKGAAMANDGRSNPTLTNCTFARNHARDMYGALYSGTGSTNVPNVPLVVNCIFWGNTAYSGPKEIGNWHECRTLVSYSCVEGGYPGEGNIDADPLFVDADAGDFRLGPSSPCIDCGHGGFAPPVDRDGNPRYDDKGSPVGPMATVPFFPKGAHLPEPRFEAQFQPPVDMGAYERQTGSLESKPAVVVYVNARKQTGLEDGRSWATAYSDLQEALSAAYRGAAEVWVAAGVYRPTGGAERRISFRLKKGLALYGGFRGDETSREGRDWVANETVLSGDLSGPLGVGGNSYHVLLGADGATLDGFTVTGGTADGEAQAVEGGALYNYNLSSPTLSDCEFRGNRADKGGAMVNRVGASPVLQSCLFSENTAEWRGGALLIDYGSGPKLSRCVFTDNHSGGHGGGVFLESVAAQLGIVGTHFDGCTFRNNSATLRGGAIASTDGGDPTLTGCTFQGNRAGTGGGALSNDYFVTATVRDCTFAENSGGEGADDVDTDPTSQVVG